MPHIISVPDRNTLDKFLQGGFIGVRLPDKFYKDIKKGVFLLKKDAIY